VRPLPPHQRLSAAPPYHFRPDLGVTSRRAALDLLMGLFKPGEIVALALASPMRAV